MPDWSSPAELANDSAIFVKFMHAILGLYAWEFIISLSFDWEVLTGKKRFRWPLIFYFADRYLLLFALIGIAIALDTQKELNCQALYTFNQLAGDAAVGLASINLSIRTLAIWAQNKWISILLVVVILGHWALILQGVLLKASWSPEINSCVITSTNNRILAATFTYSMVFDLGVFALNAYKLGMKRKGKSKLGKLIFKDGLIFFFIAFIANLLATTFMFLNLNSIMNVIFNVPAAVASTIVATRAVRRLTNFSATGPEVLGASTSNSAFQFRPQTSSRSPIASRPGKPIGVHVQMETFTHAEQDISQHELDYAETKKGSAGSEFLDLEAKGNAI